MSVDKITSQDLAGMMDALGSVEPLPTDAQATPQDLAGMMDALGSVEPPTEVLGRQADPSFRIALLSLLGVNSPSTDNSGQAA